MKQSMENSIWDKLANAVAFIIVISIFMLWYKPAYSVALISFALFVIADYFKHRCFYKIEITDIRKGIGLFLGSVLLASLGTLSVNNFLEGFDLVYKVLPCFMVTYLSKGYNIKKGVFLGLVFIIVTGIMMIFYEYFKVPAKNRAYSRPGSFLGYTNNWSAFLSMVLPCFIYYSCKGKSNLISYLSRIMVVTCIVSLYFTKSRGGMLAESGAIVITSLYYLYLKRKQFAICLTGLLALLGACSSKFIYSSVMLKERAHGDSLRWFFYEKALQMWRDYPIFGTGFGDWRIIYSTTYAITQEQKRFFHCHNFYLQILSGGGIVVALGTLGFLYYYFREMFGNIKRGSVYSFAGLAFMLAFLLHGFVDAVFFIKYVQRVFWMLFFVYTYDVMSEDEE